ncbi:MAG: glycerophosphodiester phosphodiesterase [Candidatus Bipolaricaulota bacterium]|nr:glycerophosphodiester phosphodiesterase [Candidatus Bipolaricaulota bacterium]
MKRILIALGIVLAIGLIAVAQGKIVIGHRGAAGYLPEHTLEGYAYAYALEADYVEPDLVLTKDAQFICMHDIYLNPTTDVETVFPNRHRSDGHWYAADFTLAEIKTLSVHERCKSNGTPYFPDRFPVGKSRFDVPTFAEMIELVQSLNKSTGRDVGIYPELKRPSWHDQQGLPMEQALINMLDRYSYMAADAKVYVQCFEPDSLKKLRELATKIPLIQLVSASWAYASMWTEEGLDAIASYANGIGPSKKIIEKNPQFVAWAHERDLVVHPYTFRKDSLPSQYANLSDELDRFYYHYNVDGVFTDFVDIAATVLDSQ